MKLRADFHLLHRIRRCGSVSPPPIHPNGILMQSSVITGLEMDLYS